MLSRACESSAAAKPCNHSTDLEGFLAPTSLNVSGVGNISVPFGTDPADAVAAFIHEQVYEGMVLTTEDAQTIMTNICGRAKCRKQLDLTPTNLPVQGELNGMELNQ